MTARSRVSTGVLLVTLVLSLVAPAQGATSGDPNYARGPLDLKRMVATKHDATAPLHLKLITYGRWKAHVLAASGRSPRSSSGVGTW